jgi:membrane protein YdbS with pleckstrin-like domain
MKQEKRMEIFKMKKIILVVMLCLFLIVNLFATDWYSYIGKKVQIHITTQTFIGVVRSVVDIEICKQKDAFGNCIYKEYIYTLYLETDKGVITIPCEAINLIEEING